MATKIRELEQVLGASGRQNKYRVSFAFPSAVPSDTNLEHVDILAKSAVAPQKEIGLIELWNQGRKWPIPGDTVFDNTWPVSFYLGEDHSLRVDMIRWQDACDNFYANKHSGDPSKVMSDLKIEQLDSAGNVTATYTLHGCWPSVVGEVTYADDAENSPTEFEVTFTFTDWVLGTEEEPNYSVNAATKNATAL